MRTKEENLRLREMIERALVKCEETGKFPFRSRRLFSVGEWELAFDGIYRFAKGNREFQETLEPEFSIVANQFADEINDCRLPPYNWR